MGAAVARQRVLADDCCCRSPSVRLSVCPRVAHVSVTPCQARHGALVRGGGDCLPNPASQPQPQLRIRTRVIDVISGRASSFLTEQFTRLHDLVRCQQKLSQLHTNHPHPLLCRGMRKTLFCLFHLFAGSVSCLGHGISPHHSTFYSLLRSMSTGTHQRTAFDGMGAFTGQVVWEGAYSLSSRMGCMEMVAGERAIALL